MDSLFFITFLWGFVNVKVFCIQWDVFSTKTLYEWSHDVTTPVSDNVEMLTSHNNQLCEAVHINAVIRHGARNPSIKNLMKMAALRDKLVASKPAGVATYIDSWQNLYDKEREKELVEKGIKEQYELGRRFARKFFRLLDSGREEDINFVSSSKSRAKDSSKNFYSGLQYIFSKLEHYKNDVDDDALRFYDDCGNYERRVENNKTNFKEFDDFHKTEAYISVAKSIRKNLSFNVSLGPDEVYILYEMCSYEKYIYNNEVWCKLMTDADRKILEYGQDLEKFYESSYGNRLNTKLSCPLIQEMFDSMDDVIDEIKDHDNHTVAVFQFGHSETVVQAFTALGLFKDSQPLLATNMASMKNRQFRTSEIVPFSANLAFVLFACAEGHVHDADDRDVTAFVLKILVNEKPVTIPACNKEQCLYKDVRKYYHDLADHCNRKAMCGDDYHDDDDHDHDDDDDHRDDDDDDGKNGTSGKLAYSLTLFLAFALLLMW